MRPEVPEPFIPQELDRFGDRAPDTESPEPPDDVNHPSHYTSHPSGIECIQVTEHMSFCIGNAVKYLWRNGLKGDEAKRLEDLRKARWYIEREIERLERGEPK